MSFLSYVEVVSCTTNCEKPGTINSPNTPIAHLYITRQKYQRRKIVRYELQAVRTSDD